MAISEEMLLYLLLVNSAAFILMGFDKMTAKMGSSRIPEAWFLLLSLAGGVLGVVAVAMVVVLPILIYLLL